MTPSVAVVDGALAGVVLAGDLDGYELCAVERPPSGHDSGGEDGEGDDEYDAVVVDWDHPDAERLAADRLDRPWGVVAVVDPDASADPVAAGADDFVTRPVGGIDLRRALDCVRLQRTYLAAVGSATADDADWSRTADDSLAALREKLGYAQLFRRLL